MVKTATRTRQIGRWGTAARIVVGTAFVAVGVALRPSALDVALGLLVMPAIVVGALALRGWHAAPLRLDGPFAHAANLAIGLALLSTRIRIGSTDLGLQQAALLFYGASMLLAAWRGMGACELFAISNALRRRDDQLGCPVFLPVDSIEARRVREERVASPLA